MRRHVKQEHAIGERGAVEILEEAVQLLCKAPSPTIATYLAGSIPFFVGLLFFSTDMARNPFAPERLPAESLGLAALFVWKSVWQAIFEARLYRQVSLSETQPMNLMRVVAIQSALQPFCLVAIPVSALVAIPFPWTVAFFRNAGLFAALGRPHAIPAARHQAGLWTRQNWLLLSLVSLGGALLFANVLISIMLLPQIGRSFLGIEGDFARLGMGLLNWSTISVAACIMWVIIDPLLDAAYALRCFYGESLATGEDLRLGLKRAIGAAALALFLFLGAPSARAQDAPADHPIQGQETQADDARSTIDAQRLERTIGEVIRRREFAWREPRPAGPEPQGRWASWVRSALDTLGRGVSWLLERIANLLRRSPQQNSSKEPATERPPIEIWIAVVAVALIAAAIAALSASRRKKTIQAQPAAAGSVSIDIADESVTADQMPESSWLRLAEELAAKGDCRLALRALYLAGLNFLSERNLVSIRRWKSGRDYRRELERRARVRASVDANLTPAFARNVFWFERGWYGRHPVERTDVEAFALGLEEIRRYADRT